MAAANSPYSSTEETTNANRACRLLLGPCTDQLRDVLRKEVPPSTFATEIMKQKHNLPRLTLQQRNIILPQNGSYSGTYDDYDISLLYILLRNICNITPHKKGWGNIPDVSDACLSANIERIREARNSTVHSAKPSLSITEFNDIWTYVRAAVVAIDAYLSNGRLYERNVDILRKETMDPVQDKYYRDQLTKQYADDQECIRKLDENIKSYHEETSSKISHLEARQTSLEEQWNLSSLGQNEHPKLFCIPENIRDHHKRTLQSWEKDVFYETSYFKDVKDFFIAHQTVVVVGSPGSGKTALIRHIALQLEAQYQIVPISKPEDIITYGDIKISQIFIIDDVLGVFTLERNLLSDLERHSMQIESVLDVKTRKSKLLMSCRLAVYNEAKELDVAFFEENNILSLDSKDTSLTPEDRKGIFESHIKNVGISCFIEAKLLHEKKIFMFPLLCQVFSCDKSIRKYGTDFFKYPAKCLLTEIGKIQKRNSMQYLSMVLCMLNNNCLSETKLNDKRKLESVCRSCKIKENVQNWKIIEHLVHLIGTYITEKDKKYVFTHDSIFEVVAHHYGKQFPDQILEYMNSTFTANKVVLGNTETGNDLCIKLNKSQYENLARRLYVDVKEGKLHDVFLNRALLDSILKKQFMKILKKLPYEEVRSSFLLPKEECFESIILDSKKHSENENDETMTQRESERQNLLLGLKCIEQQKIYEIRAISFIIYYGHFDLLKYFVQLVVKHHEVTDIVFGCTQEEHVRLLVLACYNGNLDMVKFLIENIGEGNINRMPVEEVYQSHNRHRYITPVIAACLKLKLKVIKYLVNNGADLNAKNCLYPALWTPARIGDLKSLITLIELGANCKNCSKREISPLYLRSRFGHVDVVEKLIEYSADINKCELHGRSPLFIASSKGHLPVVEKLTQQSAEIDKCDIHGQSPLHLASQKSHLPVVETLIQYGAECDLCDKNKITPLHRASLKGHSFIVKKLMKHGANIKKCENHGLSPLSLASWKGHHLVVEILIEQGADINSCDIYGQSSLFLASSEGHIPTVYKLIERGADINKCNTEGQTPLHIASSKGYLPVVEKLIEVGAEIDEYDIHGQSSLFLASSDGHFPVVDTFIKKGADINKCNTDEQTPLHIASSKGHHSVVEKLIERSADINKCDKNGQSSLHLASQNGHLLVVETLLQHGAEYDLCEKNDLTPLHRASLNGYATIVETLLKNGANINKVNIYSQSSMFFASLKGHLPVVEKLIENCAAINICDIHGQSSLHVASRHGHLSVVETLILHAACYVDDVNNMTPLHNASLEGHASVVEELINYGVDINKRDRHGRVALHLASSKSHLLVVESLIENGADINMCDFHGQTSLHLASQSGHSVVVKTLIRNGAECNCFDKNKLTPLHKASLKGNSRVVEELLAHGSDINMVDMNGQSSLYLASTNGNLTVVEILIQQGADINKCDTSGQSPLHLASSKGHLSVVEILIQQGADINKCDTNGQSPLHLASSKGHLPVVEILIQQGADINKCDTNGQSPLHLASSKGHLPVVEILIQQGADINKCDTNGQSPLHFASLEGHLMQTKL